MHRALEYLFQQIDNQQSLQALGDAQLQSLCEKAAEQAVGYLTRNHKALMTPRFQSLELSRTRELLLKFLRGQDAESGRAEYRVIELEQKHHWVHNDLHFNLVIDRLDQLADGSFAVIDYKTGKASPGSSA